MNSLDNRNFGKGDLSIDAILEYLVVLEKKVPHKRYTLYRPSIELVDVVTEELMNREAKRIMDFVGLSGYDVNVKFATLENAAGNTIPGGVNGVIPINVDPTYADWKCVLATLAHEVCHTLIFHNYIRPDFTWKTEIFTDLATIVSGLGNLTLGGCTTTLPDGSPCSLGYLTTDNYSETYHLINALYGYNDGIIGVCGNDSIGDLLNVWRSKGAREAHRTAFKKNGAKVAELHRNIQEIRNILSVYEKDTNTIQSDLSSGFVDDPEAEPFRAFQSLYLSSKRDVNSWALETIETTLYNLYITLDQKHGTKLSTETQYQCPKCGRVHTIRHDGSGLFIGKCRCGFTFTATKNNWSPASVEYRISQEKQDRRKREAAHDRDVVRQFIATLPKWMQWFAYKKCA
jgi:acetone carboxylase gamma subunit